MRYFADVGAVRPIAKREGRLALTLISWVAAATMALALLPGGASDASAAQPWGFEQVTPAVKGSGAVSAGDTFRSSPDGDSLLYTAVSPFSTVPAESSPQYVRYLATRGSSGWTSHAVDPPFSDRQAYYLIMQTLGSSVNLSYAVVVSTVALTPGATEGGGNLYMRDTRTGALTLIATSDDVYFAEQFTNPQGAVNIKYVAPDGRSALFNSSYEPNGVSGTPGGTLYGWTQAGGLEAESILPAAMGGATVPGTIAAGGESGEGAVRDGLPQVDGMAHVYFNRYPGEEPAVYVRSNGETKAVSVSRIPGDPTTPVPASALAVAGGSRYLLLRTRAATPLTLDTPTGPEDGGYLYRYDADENSLTYVGTLGTTFESLALQMTQDGQTVAFKSSVALTPDTPSPTEGGAVNFYVWHEGVLHYVATTESGSAATGESFMRVLSTDGRYFTFTDNSKTLAAEFGQDDILSDACPPPFSSEPGPCSEVYLYDFNSEELQCASCVPGGQVPVGDNLDRNSIAVRMDSHQMQSVGNDGTVYFTTPNPLLPEDRDGANDVYAYNDGDLRLVSRALPGTSARLLDVAPDGRTVFFSTNDAIVPTDTDNAVDVYMTREGAGYPYAPPVVTPPCGGIESCHGASTPIPGSSAARTAGFSGRGNPAIAPVGKLKMPKAKTVGTVGVLKVTVPAGGVLTASGAKLSKATKRLGKAGTYTIKVRLPTKARRTLKKAGSLKARVKVRFTPGKGTPSSLSRTLTFSAHTNLGRGH